MKDEELADKYAEEYFGKKTELVEVWKLKSCKDNFLAGLKAGRPQWHDLRKNKNLVPDSPRLVLVQCIDSTHCEFSYYINNSWILNRNVPVIAWCELPTFDKE